jgi:membrane protein
VSEETTRAGQPVPRFPILRRIATRALAEIRLTALAVGRGAMGVYNGEDLTFASSIAYYALLSLFPFFLLAFSILASVAGTEADRAAIFLFVFRYFPQQFTFIQEQFASMQTNRLQLGVAGSILMIWAAMGVFGAVTSAVNHAWGVEKQPSYFKHKLVSLLMLMTSALLMILGLLLVSAMNVVEASWFAHILDVAPRLHALQTYAWQSASTVLFIFVVGLVFYFVPNAKVRFRDVWVGAVLTGLLWRLALAGFSRYLKDASRLSVHGTIEGVIAFLLWVYVSAVIFLFGVEVTAAYARMRRHRPDDIPAAPTPRV